MDVRPIEFHPQAVDDASEARRWYEERSSAAAEAFVAELDSAVAQLGDHPGRWPAHMHGTRRYLLKRFPIAVVYRETASAIQIIAVAHAKRRPGYWVQRLNE